LKVELLYPLVRSNMQDYPPEVIAYALFTWCKVDNVTAIGRLLAGVGLAGHTSIKIFMKLQDAEKTWELLRGQAGQSTIVRTSGFSVKDQGTDYRDSMQTTVEKEDRVVLRDLQEQIEGEAHFVFSGQIVRGDMFYANPSLKKAQLRVPQLLQLGQEGGYAQAA